MYIEEYAKEILMLEDFEIVGRSPLWGHLGKGTYCKGKCYELAYVQTRRVVLLDEDNLVGLNTIPSSSYRLVF